MCACVGVGVGVVWDLTKHKPKRQQPGAPLQAHLQKVLWVHCQVVEPLVHRCTEKAFWVDLGKARKRADNDTNQSNENK